MQNKEKFPSAPTAEISVVQECGSVYNEEWIVPICGTDNEQEGEDTIIGMNRHKRVRCALALLTMLTAGLLSGCVSDAASDSTLPTITVGSDTYPPYVYMDNNGDITGLDVDIAEEAFRRMGYRAEFTTIDWEQKTKLVDNGEIDCIWGCFSMDGRENDYQWAGPYLVSRQVIAVGAQSGIERMSDLTGKTIAVQATGKPEADLSERRRKRPGLPKYHQPR